MSIDQIVVDPNWITDIEKRYAKVNEIDPPVYGLCLYTDGGGKIESQYGATLRQYGSYGIHGYLYVRDWESKTGHGVKGYQLTDYGYILNENQDKLLTVFTPGSKTPSTPAPTASIMPVCYIDILEGLYKATNNVGEAQGLLSALRLIKHLSKQHTIHKACIVADSRYVINTFINLQDYKDNAWLKKSDKQEIANRALWEDIYDVYYGDKTWDTPLFIEWTKGHSLNFGNIQADLLSSQALIAAGNAQYEQQIALSPAKGHWTKKTVETHPFLSESYWFFKSQMEFPQFNGKPLLYIGTLSDVESFGQPNATDLYGVISLNQTPPELDVLYNIAPQLDHPNPLFETQGILYSNLDNVFSKNADQHILNGDGRYLRIDHAQQKLTTAQKKPVLERFHIQRLSVITYGSVFLNLQELLARVSNQDLLPGMALTDITHLFYKTVEKKTKTSVEFLIDSGDAFIEPECEYYACHLNNTTPQHINIRLTFGITAPRRRLFNAIKDLEPQIKVLTIFEPTRSVRFYTFIQLKNGECGLWTNTFTNNKLIYAMR